MHDLDTRIARFLFQYRLMPHSSTGIFPAGLLFRRRPRLHLDFIHPDLSSKVSSALEHQMESHKQHAVSRTFLVGDNVYIHNSDARSSEAWVILGKATIQSHSQLLTTSIFADPPTTPLMHCLYLYTDFPVIHQWQAAPFGLLP